MTNIIYEEERVVIPNWRSFGKTTVLGELDAFRQAGKKNEKVRSVIEGYAVDFKLKQTLIHASELLSAAISNGLDNEDIVVEAANFLQSNKNEASLSQTLLANAILNKNGHPVPEECLTNLKLLKELDGGASKTKIKIHETRNRLRQYPYNPILYVELSRYYSLLGQSEHAINSMRIASNLAPDNRFVLRCATRLSKHFNSDKNDLLEEMRRKLNRNSIAMYDPWLLSAEIAISMQLGKTSRFIKKGMEFIESGDMHPLSFTELASSIATVEMEHGAHKKSRALFNKSLISPNDNSFAQIEWAAQKDRNIILPIVGEINIKRNYEALAMGNYHNEKYDYAVSHMVEWLLDQPFAKEPSVMGSYIASTFTKNYDMAINLAKAGLISHPNDSTLNNNLAYALALSSRPRDALDILDKTSQSTIISSESKVCLKATRGLVMFRLGGKENMQIGRGLYREAIDNAHDLKNQNLIWIALLNYAREELISPSPYLDEVLGLISTIPDKNLDPSIKNLKSDAMDEYQKARKRPEKNQKKN